MEKRNQALLKLAATGGTFLVGEPRAPIILGVVVTLAVRTRLREAEQMQKERGPAYPLLYSTGGFRFCDLLLWLPSPR